ncbi:MAG: carboxylate-amine ligase [Solirubrobacterales bacterium]
MSFPPQREPATTPEWAHWADQHELGAYTVGVEEEVMLVDPIHWGLAQRIESVLPRLPAGHSDRYATETHESALELQTGVHSRVADAMEELTGLRHKLDETLEPIHLQAAAAGTHPFAVWQETKVSSGERYEFVHGSMRELARREPTFALHVHVGVADPEDAIRAHNRMRVHLPLLLALSANSPFWQGRDTGLASARTPLFQAFPRVGIPRPFRDYVDYTERVDLLIRTGAVPEPTFLWWDVRPQPRFGTIEVRVMDAQTLVQRNAGLTALTQCLTRLEVEEGHVSEDAIDQREALTENRFIAARDGIEAELIDSELGERVAVRKMLPDLLALCRPHAQELGCVAELETVLELLEGNSGAERQIERARSLGSLPRLVAAMAADFLAGP